MSIGRWRLLHRSRWKNLVKYAGIFGDKDHCAGHNGIGAVMGVKKLKAFCAPLGKTPIKVASPGAPGHQAIWRAMQRIRVKRIFDMGTSSDYEPAISA
jgi:hypothetical protein